MRIMGIASLLEPFFAPTLMLARMPTALPDVLSRHGGRRASRIATVGTAAAALVLGCGTPGTLALAGTAPAPNALSTAPPAPAATVLGAPHAALPPDLP